MDIAFCVLNTETNELYYAGAINPLWIVKENTNTIEEIKATRQSIGKVDNPVNYQTTKIQLEKNDLLYIFSDGLVDQFGGLKGKKFKYNAFKELLLSLKNEPMQNQLSQINKHFESWKGGNEQVDDVCVFGVKI